MELPSIRSRFQGQWEPQLTTFIPPKGRMVVEPVVVDIIDKARIESYLFRRSYVVKLRGMFETPQIVVILKSRHRGERVIGRTAIVEKCGGGALVAERLCLARGLGVIQSTHEACQVSNKSAYYSLGHSPEHEGSSSPGSRRTWGQVQDT
jgi:hypothetical protein